MIDAMIVSFIAGFAGAHWTHVLLYEKDFSHPMRLLEIWKGISSMGGFLFGAMGCWIFLYIKKLPILKYGDLIVRGVLLALFWGRLGCTVAHDHPGTLTNFFLGVRYPDGARHNLGMEEAILVGLLILILRQKKISMWLSEKDGKSTAIIAIAYGVLRFCLDFLRAEDLMVTDPRYAGLTPAQYICVLLIVAGAAVYCRIYKKPSIK